MKLITRALFQDKDCLSSYGDHGDPHDKDKRVVRLSLILITVSLQWDCLLSWSLYGSQCCCIINILGKYYQGSDVYSFWVKICWFILMWIARPSVETWFCWRSNFKPCLRNWYPRNLANIRICWQAMGRYESFWLILLWWILGVSLGSAINASDNGFPISASWHYLPTVISPI